MKKYLNKMDKWLLFITLIYSILGLVMIFSSSSISAVLRYNVSPDHFFVRQLFFLVASWLVGWFFVLRFPIKKYKLFVHIAILVIIVLLIGLFPYGMVVNGTKGWYDLGFASLQPAEFAKSILIIYLAIYFGRKKHLEKENIYTFLKPIILGITIVVLVAMQPDLGGAAIIAGIILFVFLALPNIKNNSIKLLKIIGASVFIFVIVFMVTGNSFLSERQLSRLNYRNPCTRYTENTGYQVCNSLIAVSNGGLFGKGLGNSSQKYLYLPESHTDFIFPIIAEELGSIVATLIIIGYLFILYRILKIALSSETLTGSILCYGTFILILLHLLINLLGVFALIPLTGVPLPFLSYGGSFTFNLIILMFLVQRVCIENKILKEKKEIANLS